MAEMVAELTVQFALGGASLTASEIGQACLAAAFPQLYRPKQAQPPMNSQHLSYGPFLY